VLTCLANDVGFEHVFSHQLETLASSGDILIALSGSGNSPNIVRALTTGRTIGLRTWSVLGFDGGRAIEQSDRSIHFEIHDMQVAEDCQMVVCHVLTKKLAGDEG
jgi:D-sedoheptulose 7-phosphate isomerase